MDKMDQVLSIRQYQQEDLAIVKALHIEGLKQYGEDYDPYFDSDLDNIEEIYLNNNGDFLIGICDEEIVAIGAIRKVTTTKAVLKRIRVRRDIQRKGHGQTILRKLIGRASELGYRQLCLDTQAVNIAAQRLFEKHGFFETRRDKTVSQQLVFYEKELD